MLMQADALIVREKLMDFLTADEVDGYSAVRKIAQAMVYLVGALTSVMFPKVARSFQRSEKTDVLKLTIALTAIIGVVGAILATLFPEVPLRVLSPARLLASKGLVTAYCWALLPLTLANVLVWSLLARESYRVVPWLAALALGYWITLQNFHDRLQTVIAVAAAFGSAFMLVSAAFLWLESRTRARASPPTSIPGSGPE